MSAMGKTSSVVNRGTVLQWNKECQEAFSACTKALTRLKRHNTSENVIEFKRILAKTCYVIKKSKKESWRNYISKITTPSEVWNKIKQLKGNKTSIYVPVLNSNSLIQTTDSAISEVLAVIFEKTSSFPNYSLDFLEFKQRKEKEQLTLSLAKYNPLDLSITLEELDFALTNCRNSAPGPDDISSLLLKKLPSSGKLYLLQAYNALYLTGSYPALLR